MVQFHPGHIIVVRPNATVVRVTETDYCTIAHPKDMYVVLEVHNCWPHLQNTCASVFNALTKHGVPNVEDLDWALCAQLPDGPFNFRDVLTGQLPDIFLVCLNHVVAVTDKVVPH